VGLSYDSAAALCRVAKWLVRISLLIFLVSPTVPNDPARRRPPDVPPPAFADQPSVLSPVTGQTQLH
jgi:hypothetical protein